MKLIFAFEPAPSEFRPLRNNIGLNGIISILDSVPGRVSKVDILKVDAEGYEARVLLGATETLKKTDHIVIKARHAS